MNVYLTKHLAVFTRVRDQRHRKDLVEKLTDWLDQRLDPQLWSVPHEPRDPHDVESRKWFRRTLITLCVLGFIVITAPPSWIDFTGQVEVEGPPLRVVSGVCYEVTITGSNVMAAKVVDIESRMAGHRLGATVWYECVRTFSDGSWFVRLGDAKP